MKMDWPLFWTIFAAVGTGVGLIYAFLRNFKTDINSHIDRLEGGIKDIKEDNKKMDQRVTETNKRMDGVYHLLLKKLDANTP
jgi:hypothetical protein